MPEKYFAVFGVQSLGGHGGIASPTTTWESAKLLEDPKAARVCKVEAENVAEAQQAVAHFFAGMVPKTTVVVTEAQWKES